MKWLVKTNDAVVMNDGVMKDRVSERCSTGVERDVENVEDMEKEV